MTMMMVKMTTAFRIMMIMTRPGPIVHRFMIIGRSKLSTKTTFFFFTSLVDRQDFIWNWANCVVWLVYITSYIRVSTGYRSSMKNDARLSAFKYVWMWHGSTVLIDAMRILLAKGGNSEILRPLKDFSIL